jgi:hypothetical protein
MRDDEVFNTIQSEGIRLATWEEAPLHHNT